LVEQRFVALDVGLADFDLRRKTKQALKPRDRLGALRRRHLVGR